MNRFMTFPVAFAWNETQVSSGIWTIAAKSISFDDKPLRWANPEI